MKKAKGPENVGLGSVPRPSAGPGAGRHRGLRDGHLRHGPAHPARRVQQRPAGGHGPRGHRTRGGGRRRRGGAPRQARRHGDLLLHLRQLRRLPCRTSQPLPQAPLHRLARQRRLRAATCSSRPATSTRSHPSVGEHAGALYEPLSCVTQCLCDPAVASPGDTALVVGPGAMGILCAQVLRAQGARVTVSGTPADRRRLDIAAVLGLEVVEAGDLASVTPEGGFDVVADASGNERGIDAGAASHAQGRPLRAGRPDRPAHRLRHRPHLPQRAGRDLRLRQHAALVAAPGEARRRGPRRARPTRHRRAAALAVGDGLRPDPRSRRAQAHARPAPGLRPAEPRDHASSPDAIDIRPPKEEDP